MLRIKQAIKIHNKLTGQVIYEQDLAALIWPNSNHYTRKVSMSRLSNGLMKGKPEWIQIISEATGVPSDYILGMKTKTDYDYDELLKPKVKRKYTKKK